MDISLMIEGQMGLTWPRWTSIARAAEDLGFAGLYRSDHFVNPSGDPDESLEMIVSLAWLAANTTRLRFGCLVAPMSFRDPVMLARQAAAIGDLSGGRMRLGLGAGWNEREHAMFGYDLGDVPTRFDRFAEGLSVAARLLRDQDPVTFEGLHYAVRDAVVKPRGAGVPIVVGGNGMRRTLALAAMYGDEWNGVYLTLGAFAERVARLGEMLADADRPADAVRRSLMTGVAPGRDEQRLRDKGVIAGTDAQMRAQLDELEAAGCHEVMLQWLALEDLDGLREMAQALIHA